MSLKDQPSRAIAVVAICFGIFKTVQLIPACMLRSIMFVILVLLSSAVHISISQNC